MNRNRKRTIVPSAVLIYRYCDSWNGGYGVEERQELVEDRSAFLDVFVSYFPLAKVMKAVCSSGKLACAGLRSVNKTSSCYGRSLRVVADTRITQMHYFRNFFGELRRRPLLLTSVGSVRSSGPEEEDPVSNQVYVGCHSFKQARRTRRALL